MGPDEHLGAKALDDITFRVELVDRVVRLQFAIGQHAIDAEPATSRDGERACFIAADEGPDALAVDVDVDRSRRAHFPATRQPRPFASQNAWATAVRQSPHRAIRVVRGALAEN